MTLAIYLGLNALILLAALLVALLLLRAAWRATRKDPLACMAGFLIALWMFPFGPSELWDVLTTRIPESVARVLAALQTNWPPSAEQDWLVEPLSAIIRMWGQTLQVGPTPYYSEFPGSFLLAWLAIALFLGSTTRRQLVDRYRGLSPTAQKNLLFFLILAIGGYLSIAAIAAIPNFREEDVPAEVAPDQLAERLKQSVTEETFKKTFPEELLQRDPFLALDTLLGTPAREATGGADLSDPTRVRSAGRFLLGREQPAGPQENFSAIVVFLNVKRAKRTGLVESWRVLRSSSLEALLRAQNAALKRFEVDNLGRVGIHERIEHFQTLDSWFSERVADEERQLRDCISKITEADASWQTLVDRVVGADPQSIGLDVVLREAEADAAYSAQWACSTVYTSGIVPPARPPLGSHLTGPFGFMARWLLRTESMGLVMITGLLGFGLLGAACSSFVRERRQANRRSDRPLVENLGGVVITGFGAAVVVFLAVEGGLAIFSTGSSEPNPYVLLFTCLLAAVFSEEVWDWAYDRLKEGLGGAKLTTNGTGATPDQAAAPRQGVPPA